MWITSKKGDGYPPITMANRPIFPTGLSILKTSVETILKPKTSLTQSGFASMSMTADAAIRIVFYSAEFVQLYPQDTNSLVYPAYIYATAHYLR